jgi:cephalosporin hydroxylase
MDFPKLFVSSPRRCIKWSSYFQVYGELLQRFCGQKVTLVEIGILDGGSLFMWREFLGPQARIIGIDLNPLCRELEKDGFEIFIGDQSKPEFWSDFFAKVGDVDVLIDDGGHTNLHQLATLRASLEHVRDGGLVLVEDVHASYMGQFGNPHRFSFINRCKQAIDEINARCPEAGIEQTVFSKTVHSIAFYESIVAFQINRLLCVTSESLDNGGAPIVREDPSKKDIRTQSRGDFMGRARSVYVRARLYTRYRLENSRLGGYFR